jgi:hypothetical protein
LCSTPTDCRRRERRGIARPHAPAVSPYRFVFPMSSHLWEPTLQQRQADRCTAYQHCAKARLGCHPSVSHTGAGKEPPAASSLPERALEATPDLRQLQTLPLSARALRDGAGGRTGLASAAISGCAGVAGAGLPAVARGQYHGKRAARVGHPRRLGVPLALLRLLEYSLSPVACFVRAVV